MSYKGPDGNQIVDMNLTYYFFVECLNKNAKMITFINNLIDGLNKYLTNDEFDMLYAIKQTVEIRDGLLSDEQRERINMIKQDMMTNVISPSDGHVLTVEIISSNKNFQEVNAFFNAVLTRDYNIYRDVIRDARQIAKDMFVDTRCIDFDFYPAMFCC